MKKLLLLSAIIAAFASCDDIFEKKLDRYTVEVITPQKSATMESGDILFSWKNMEGALRYQLVIVEPSFVAAMHIAADTLVTVNDSTFVNIHKCTVNLQSGSYQWCVQAQNTNYSSQKQIYDLTVVE